MRRTLTGLLVVVIAAVVALVATDIDERLGLDLGPAREAAGVVLGGLDGGGEPSDTAAGADDAVDVTRTTARLDDLDVKGKAPRTGYDRDEFDHWTDPDGNGCDARNDALARDLDGETVEDGCTVLAGTLAVEPYTGETDRTFERASDDLSVSLDAEHLVALQNAWISGAHTWDDARREEFANDPANLLMVDPGENRSKGAANAAEWLPPNSAFRCRYVATQVDVKADYGLAVTPAEKDAMHRVLESC